MSEGFLNVFLNLDIFKGRTPVVSHKYIYMYIIACTTTIFNFVSMHNHTVLLEKVNVLYLKIYLLFMNPNHLLLVSLR